MNAVHHRRLPASKLSCWRASSKLFEGKALGPFVIYEDRPPFVVRRSDQTVVSKHDSFEDAYGAMAEAVEAWCEELQGWTYFIGSDLKVGRFVKIGTATNVQRRLKQLQAASPVPLRVFATVRGGVEVERAFHAKWHRFRGHGEWFRLTPGMCRAIEELAA